MIYFSTWMYEENARDGGLYAQVGGAASSFEKRLIYWRCVMLFFALARQHTRHRNDLCLCLFTNAKHLPIVDGVELDSYLGSIGVRIIRLDYRWRPEFPDRNWYNQFYVFDILDFFEVEASDDDHFIIADSDCLAAANLDPLFAVLSRDGYLTIDVETTPDEDINGLSRNVAATLYAALGGTRQPLAAPYFGGEFIGISGRLLGRFLALSRDAFACNNRLAQSSMRYLTEEAHLISYTFVQMGVSASNVDHFVRRIWTSWKSNNTRKSDLDLLVWHVPAEKIFGIKTLTQHLARKVLGLEGHTEFDSVELAARLGVGKRRVRKTVHQLGFAIFRRISRVVMPKRPDPK